ncbi:MAG TPA: hypothetical protein VF212_02240 [Longimicrobiales bacterium]
MNRIRLRSGAAGAALLLISLAGCDRLRPPELTLPTDAQAAEFYRSHDAVEHVAVNGTIVEVRVRQPASQLRRGGALWAKVGPYIYLFSPDTEKLLQAYSGVAAVRVTTVTDGDREVSRVMLRRDALSDILWRRSQNLLGHALQRGTEQPRLLEHLIDWGEEYTEYEYSPEFVSR